MNKIHKKRLLKMADFLEKLPRKKFDFSSVVAGSEMPSLKHDCGSAACAIGWLPVVFPRMFKYRANQDGTFLVDATHGFSGFNLAYMANKAFGVSWDESDALFVPDTFQVAGCGMRRLGDNATPKQVARNIRKFIEYKEKNT